MPYVLRRPLLAGAFLLVGSLIVFRLRGGPPRPAAGDVSALADGRTVVLRGCVAAPPDRRGRMTSFVLDVSALRLGPWGPFAPARGRVAVTAPGRAPAVEWGDDALFWGRLKPLRPAAAPGAYDEGRLWRERGVFCRLAARPSGGEALVPAGPRSALWWVTQARRRFDRAFARLPPPARAVVAGLVLGRKPAGFPDMQDDFRRSGTIHLLVASGTNVAFVLSLWWMAARWVFFLPRRAALAAGVPLAFFYAALAGGEAPVMRAAVMAAVGLTGLLLGRVDRPAHLIGAAAVVLMAAEPSSLFQAGFQLSFAATWGLVLGMPAVEDALLWAAARSWWPAGRVPRFLIDGGLRLFAAGALSQLALSPFLILHFQRMSLAGLFVNLLAVPWATVCLGLGAGLFFVDVLCPPLAGAWAWATGRAATGLWGLAAWGARWPGAEVPVVWTSAQAAVWGAAVAGTFVLFSVGRRARAGSGFAGDDGLAAAGGIFSGEDAGDGTAGDAPRFPVGRLRVAAMTALWAAAGLGIWAAAPRAARETTVLWPGGAGDGAAVLRADGGAVLLDPSPAEARGAFAPFLRRARASSIDVFFSRPGVDPRPVLAALPLGARMAEGFPSGWSAAGPGAVAFSSDDGERFLFVTDARRPPPPGPWTAVSVHPRGPVKRLTKALGSVRTDLWVLRGRGGAKWEAALAAPVHRSSRDGWRTRRAGRWGVPEADIVKSAQ